MAKTVQDLAQALSESERRELFDRIQRSLSLNNRQDQTIVKAPSSSDYRNHMIQEGLGQLGLVQRLILWFRKVFTNRSDSDLFVEMKMDELGKILETHHLGDPDAGMVEPAFAQAVYQLYLAVVPIRKFLKIIWANEDALRTALQYVLEERIPRARSKLFDFIPLQEIQLLFEAAENKGTIRQELINRLNVYIDGIPGEIFTELEQGIMPLYYLRQLCFFDYMGLFTLFFVDSSALEKGTVSFKSAAVSKVLEPIEGLYYAMHTARKAASLEILPAQLYKFVQTRRYEHGHLEITTGTPSTEIFNPSDLPEPVDEQHGEGSASNDMPPPSAPAGDNPQVIEEGLRQLRKDLRQLQEVLAQAMEKTRIADVIKFFQGDPYYRFLAYVPSINLRDFYISTLRMQLLGALDKEYAAIRAMIVENIVKSLFPKGIIEFSFFRRHPFGPPRGSLAGFKYVASLQYLSNFLNTVFFGGLRDICRAIVKGLPNRNRDTGSELLFHTSGLESIHEKVKAIDYSFSGDSEEGKSFMRMKNAIEKDVAQEKQYRAYVAQRDKDNRDLLEEAIEHVRALGEAVAEVAAIPTPLLSERFSLIASQNGQQGNFGDFMRGVAIKFRTADRLLRYQRALDDETMS